MKLDEFYHQLHIWLITRGPAYVAGILIFLIGLWFIRVLKMRLRNRMSKRKVHSTLQSFFLSLTITTLYALLTLLVFNIIGWKLDFLSAIIASFGVAAGLALSGTFQNFAGGVLILMLKPFELNDNIVAQGQDGVVTSIQLFYTVLLTADNRTIIIPNGKLFNEVIVNVTREGKRRIDFDVRVSYASDVDKAKQIMLNAIKSTNGILNELPVRAGIISLDVDSIRFTINVWVDLNNYLDVKIALMEKIVEDLGAAGITFPKPGI